MIEREPDAVRRTLPGDAEHQTQQRNEQEHCIEMPHPESKNTKDRMPKHSDEPGERGNKATAPEDLGSWQRVAAILHDALPQIDRALSQANMPLSSRKLRTFDIVRDTMLEVPDQKAFLLSEAHGRFLVIIEDWYRDRYGEAVDNREDDFESVILIHGLPLAMRVPKRFRIFSGEPGTFWIGFPASVQAEEYPLGWIQNRGAVRGLSDSQLESVRKSALDTANLIRSIGFDTQALVSNASRTISELAASVRADLESSARNLCAQNEAGLRSATWDTSQATEKALKVLIWQKGQTPPYTHELSRLASLAESLGAENIDRVKLVQIPSGRDAANIRYGGDMTVSDASTTYAAALSIIKQVVFEARPDTQYNLREARFKLKRPPWFNFDSDEFSAGLRST